MKGGGVIEHSAVNLAVGLERSLFEDEYDRYYGKGLFHRLMGKSFICHIKFFNIEIKYIDTQFEKLIKLMLKFI